MAETKSLKTCSITEIEEAIAKAISGLTGTEVSSEINSFIVNTSDAMAHFNGQDTFNLELSLRVGKSYTSPIEADDLPF